MPQADEGADPPRWGQLVAAIVVALLTAAWVGSTFSTAQATAAQAPVPGPTAKSTGR